MKVGIIGDIGEIVSLLKYFGSNLWGDECPGAKLKIRVVKGLETSSTSSTMKSETKVFALTRSCTVTAMVFGAEY